MLAAVAGISTFTLKERPVVELVCFVFPLFVFFSFVFFLGSTLPRLQVDRVDAEVTYDDLRMPTMVYIKRCTGGKVALLCKVTKIIIRNHFSYSSCLFPSSTLLNSALPPAPAIRGLRWC